MIVFDLQVDDLPSFANVHSTLALALSVAHLPSQNELSGVKSGLVEFSLVLLSYFGADAWPLIAFLGASHGADSVNSCDNLVSRVSRYNIQIMPLL